MTEKCCRCEKKIISSPNESVFMLSKGNSDNPYNINFYTCNHCYLIWEKLWDKEGRTRKSNVGIRGWTNWSELFFGVFLKDSYIMREKVEFT